MMKRLTIFLMLCLIVSCQAGTEVQSPMMMLRLRPTNTDTDEAWNETYKIIKENLGCCDEVWFSTGMGFLPREWHEDKAARIGRAMVQLKDIDIRSSLQFQMTIGHGDKFGVGNEHLYAEKTWRGWTGSQGVEAKYSSCPRNPQFMDYIRNVSRIYASLRPAYIWVDDDLRYDNHKPATLESHIGCWCDECIAEFNERHSGRWTRQTLASAIEKDKTLDSLWHSWCVETLCDIAAAISEEVHAVSPQTKMAFQGKKEDFVVHHVKEILTVMHEKTGIPVGYRPGTGARFDMESPSGQIVKSMQSARFISLIGNPDYVDIWCPEIETWPRVYGSRTAQGILVEAFTALAYGLNSVSMFIMAADMEEPDLYSRSLLHPISEGSQVLRDYARLNENTRVVGYQGDGSCDDLYAFARTGVPVMPGEGVSLGNLTLDFMKGVDIPKMVSTDIQTLRDTLSCACPTVCCSPFVGLLIPRVDEDGILKTVGIVNTRIDAQGRIRIKVDGVSDSQKYLVWHEMKKAPVRLPLERAADAVYVEIPEIAPWNAGFISIE